MGEPRPGCEEGDRGCGSGGSGAGWEGTGDHMAWPRSFLERRRPAEARKLSPAIRLLGQERGPSFPGIEEGEEKERGVEENVVV